MKKNGATTRKRKRGFSDPLPCYEKAPWHPIKGLKVAIDGIKCGECGTGVNQEFLLVKIADMVDALLSDGGYVPCNRCGCHHKKGAKLFNLIGEWVCLFCAPNVCYPIFSGEVDDELVPGAKGQIVKWIARHYNTDPVPDEITTIMSFFDHGEYEKVYSKIIR